MDTQNLILLELKSLNRNFLQLATHLQGGNGSSPHQWRNLMSVVSDLVAAVGRNTSTTQSAIQTIQGLKGKLDAIIANGNNDPALAQLAASLTADDDALAKAITDNTPAADEPTGDAGTGTGDAGSGDASGGQPQG